MICVREYIIQKRKSIHILETGGIKMPVQGRLKKKHLQNKDILRIKFNKILKFQSCLGIKKKRLNQNGWFFMGTQDFPGGDKYSDSQIYEFIARVFYNVVLHI